MPSYDASHFDPPAPVVTVTLFDPRNSQEAVQPEDRNRQRSPV